MRGTVVVNEVIFRIHSITLENSRIIIIATKRDVVESITLREGDLYGIFGDDGSLIANGRLHLPEGPVTAEGDPSIGPATLTIYLPLGIMDKELI